MKYLKLSITKLRIIILLKLKKHTTLRKQGFDDLHTKQFLGQCLAIELFDIIKFDKPFDNERYKKNLLALPKNPV